MGKIKIISGGQTGVDRAALDAAIKCNFPHGGWCPPGRDAHDGPLPYKYNLKETPQERSDKALHVPRSLRTEWNVRDSDGTLILYKSAYDKDQGTLWTIQAAKLYNKPYWLQDLNSSRPLDDTLVWLNKNNIKVLNIAGPSDKKGDFYYQESLNFLIKLIEYLN